MAEVVFLGTGSAVTDPHRTTTMLAFEAPGSVILVDCGGDVVQRAQQAGLRLEEIEAVIITHEHPDHTGGFALMVQKLWLAGRTKALPVHGIAGALAQARRCLEAFDTSGWDGLMEIRWTEFQHEPGALVLEDGTWRITATPGIHGVPNVALRVEEVATGRVCVYSSDTAASVEVGRFARDAAVLVHEATGVHAGHSTARQAAEIGAASGVGELYLVHLPPERELDEEEMRRVREIFPRAFKAEELQRVGFGKTGGRKAGESCFRKKTVQE